MKVNRTQLTRRVVRLGGLALFTGMMSVGYYYNLTFVQLGLFDLGERLVGLSRPAVAGNMALLALLTCLVALYTGTQISRRKVGFFSKLRLAFLVILAQTILTPIAPGIRVPAVYIAWIAACSVTLGVGVPVTFSLTIDLVPRGWRGEIAALITALAYLAANAVPASWTVEEFTRPLLWIMPVGLVSLGLIAFLPIPQLQILANQHLDPRFAQGRYAHSAGKRLFVLVVLMFGVFFVDSLGFLRLLDTPRFMLGAWQSPALDTRLLIGFVHAGAALIGGILYDHLDVSELFYWIFGIFALTHLLYTFSIRASTTNAPLAMPILYATAVSLYTVVNFALWADLSTNKTIGRNAAIGVALSGWMATFFSTAVAIWWESSGMSLALHLNIVDSLAMLFLLMMIFQALIPKRSQGQVEEGA